MAPKPSDNLQLWLLGALLTIILGLAGAVNASTTRRIAALEDKKDAFTAALSDLKTEVALLHAKTDTVQMSEQLINAKLDALIERLRK